MEIGLNQLQQERNRWVEKNFPGDQLEDSIMGAVEEMGELAHHYLKRKQGIRGDDAMHVIEMLDAVADCVIFLAGVASHLDTDYGTLVTSTWQKVQQRDWVKDPEGVSA